MSLAADETFWDQVRQLISDKRFLISTSMLPISTIGLLSVAGLSTSSQDCPTAHAAALATLRFALLWAVALSCLFLLWLAGARIFLGSGAELGRALLLSGVVAGVFYLVAAVYLIRDC
jgi:hypothetical protein